MNMLNNVLFLRSIARMMLIVISLSVAVDACMKTIPTEDIIMARTSSCTVGTKQYGTFSPAPGNRVPAGSTVDLTCAAYAHASSNAVLTAVCSNGVLSPTSPCLPCPDSTWIFDATTNRCFKGFAGPASTTPCDIRLPCYGLAATYGAPSDIAYTLNIPALIDAGTIAIQENVNPIPFYHVGIGDPVDLSYQLVDGTPVPSTLINPLFIPFEPMPATTATSQFMVPGLIIPNLLFWRAQPSFFATTPYQSPDKTVFDPKHSWRGNIQSAG
uniref:Sushi domain-containing protein n=1 Tax=Plectus sambesii TaxID=2011161 RepID=A0A914VHR8_9BILA